VGRFRPNSATPPSSCTQTHKNKSTILQKITNDKTQMRSRNRIFITQKQNKNQKNKN